MANQSQRVACGTGYQGRSSGGACRTTRRCSSKRSKNKARKKCPVGVDNPQNWLFWKAQIVEFLAVYFLIFVIGMIDSHWVGVDSWAVLLGKAVGYGFTLAICVAFAAPISGAWFHPGVTLVGLLIGSIGFLRALLYILVQFLGALAAYAHLMWVLAPADFASSLPVLAPNVSAFAGLATEGIATMFFTLFILHIAVGYGSLVIATKCGLKISPSFAWMAGLALAAAALFAGLITGASINPWRYLAAAIFTGFGPNAWIYFVAGFLGPLAGWLMYWLITGPKGQTAF